MKTLTLIGAGKLGKTLGYLFAKKDCFHIQDVLCRSHLTSQTACDFMQSGQPVSHFNELKPADAFLLAVTDDELTTVTTQLMQQEIVRANDLIFHCSGTLSSSLLASFHSRGALIASVHPIRSFGNPSNNIHNFAGTFCTIEGDEAACQLLQEKFEKIGGKTLKIQSDHKMLVHIASVFSSNYLLALTEASLTLLEQTGIDRHSGYEILESLLLGTCQNVKEVGTAKALTGPIARGDSELVKHHLESLGRNNPHLSAVYKTLGKLTLSLAKSKPGFAQEHLLKLEEIL